MELSWTRVLLALPAGPIVIAIPYGIRHSHSSQPMHDDALKAAAMLQTMKDVSELRSGGRGFWQRRCPGRALS